MTIEQKLDEYISKQNDKNRKLRLERFKKNKRWTHIQRYKHIPLTKIWNQDFNVWRISSNFSKRYLQHINKIISQGDKTECLTSGVKYIREKKLMEDE